MTGSTVDTAFEAAGWETTAAGYDDFFGRITPRVVEPLLDAADDGPGVRVLDVAAGPGYAAVRAARRGASVVGMDIAAALVSLARRSAPYRVGARFDLPVSAGLASVRRATTSSEHGRPEVDR